MSQSDGESPQATDRPTTRMHKKRESRRSPLDTIRMDTTMHAHPYQRRSRSSCSQAAETASSSAPQLPRYDPGSKRAVYVGNLPLTMDEETLCEIFSTAGSVQSVKMIEKGTLNCMLKYAFVEFDDPASAQLAIETLNSRTIQGCTLKVNIAYQSTSVASAREETAMHFTLFVGDLAPEVRDAELHEAFATYHSISDARVMWDMKTGHSRGYGFVSFRDRDEAEQAMRERTGTLIGSREIRINWANMKQSTHSASLLMYEAPGSNKLFNIAPSNLQSLAVAEQYAIVVLQTPLACTTLYLGNLAADTDKEDLFPLLAAFGMVQEVMMYADRGFAFARMDTHDHAALAIVQLQGVIVKGRPLKSSWQSKNERTKTLNKLVIPLQHGRQSSTSSAGSLTTSPLAMSPVAPNYVAHLGLGIMADPNSVYDHPRTLPVQPYFPAPLSPMLYGFPTPQQQPVSSFEMQMMHQVQQQQQSLQLQLAAQYYQQQAMHPPPDRQGSMQSLDEQMAHLRMM